MLIPFTDLDPALAARDCSDTHVVKLILEVYQGLEHYIERDSRRGYFNYPYSKWIRESAENARWAKLCFVALLEEYSRRYGKEHSYESKLEKLKVIDTNKFQGNITTIPFGGIERYRQYFQEKKSHFSTWKAPAVKPAWWTAKTKNDLKVAK